MLSGVTATPRPPQSRLPGGRLLLLVLAATLAVAPRSFAESSDAPPRPYESIEGVPAAWTDVLNGYIFDPAQYGSRLIAIERESGGNLPPVFQMAAADAYWRSGNRRAAERIFEETLSSDAGYPWDDFANLGMGTIRLTSGDAAGAEIYFGHLVDAQEASSQVLGNLGMGSALAESGRFAEAKSAFDAAAAADTVEAQFRQAGKFGSALALYGAGDFAAAARAFDELAKADPDGPMGRDAQFAAARARIAAGDREASTRELQQLVDRCDPKSASRRAPRALRNLDPRAIGRNWVRNYQRTGWGNLEKKGGSMYSIGGCALARSTLRALARNDAALTAIQPVAAHVAAEAPAAAAPAPKAGRASERHDAAPAAPQGRSHWVTISLAVAALAALGALWQMRARGAGAR